MLSNIPSKQEIKAMLEHIKWKIGNNIRLEYENSGEYTKHGIKYPNLPFRSSKPFESPRSQSGNLHSKINVQVYNDLVSIGSNVPYLKYLELGTSKMLPRNGLEIAYNKQDLIKTIDEVVKKFFR
jgi:phage gpG-like protein